MKKKTKNNKLNNFLLAAIFLTLVFILILLLHAVTLIIKHYEAFDENPLVFGADKFEVNFCTCYLDGEDYFHFNKDKVWKKNPPASFTLQP